MKILARPLTTLGTASPRFLVAVTSALAIIALLTFVAVPFLMHAPNTNHYKQIRSISAAVELELGEVRAASLIKSERLAFCSYVPIRMCAKVYIDAGHTKSDEVQLLKAIAASACTRIATSSSEQLRPVAVRRHLPPDTARKSLLGNDICMSKQGHVVKELFVEPEREGSYIVLTVAGRD